MAVVKYPGGKYDLTNCAILNCAYLEKHHYIIKAGDSRATRTLVNLARLLKLMFTQYVLVMGQLRLRIQNWNKNRLKSIGLKYRIWPQAIGIGIRSMMHQSSHHWYVYSSGD